MKHLAVTFADWHIHNYKQFNSDGQRLDNCLKVLPDLGNFCAEKGIKTILFAGDLYDQQKVLPTVVVNKTVQAFLQFAEDFPDIKIVAISGNHDHSTKNLYDKPAVSALSHIASIVPDQFFLIDNGWTEVADQVIVHGIPYYEYGTHFDKALDDAVERVKLMNEKGIRTDSEPYNAKHHLLIHQTPKGIGNDMIPFDTNPMDERYKLFDTVRCGHIHHRMDLTENFYLVGNPIHRDLADAGKAKGFLVDNLYKPEKGKVFIPLKGYPEFKVVPEDEVPEESNDYIVPKPNDLDQIKMVEDAKVESFNTGLSPAELIENFWKEVNGVDKELLTLGLSFLK